MQIREVRVLAAVLAILVLATSANIYGQAPPQPPASPKAAAPIDLAGYWVSLVTEDWRYRMLTPPKGDFTSIPLNASGRKAAGEWDPSKDEAAGEQCRAYGAGGILRVPSRIHITWPDDKTIKLDTDAGTQTRVFYFGSPQSQGGDWRGFRWPVGTGQPDRWDCLPARCRTADR